MIRLIPEGNLHTNMDLTEICLARSLYDELKHIFRIIRRRTPKKSITSIFQLELFFLKNHLKFPPFIVPLSMKGTYPNPYSLLRFPYFQGCFSSSYECEKTRNHGVSSSGFRKSRCKRLTKTPPSKKISFLNSAATEKLLYPTTNLLVFRRYFAGMGASRRQVMFIGLLPSCFT